MAVMIQTICYIPRLSCRSRFGMAQFCYFRFLVSHEIIHVINAPTPSDEFTGELYFYVLQVVKTSSQISTYV